MHYIDIPEKKVEKRQFDSIPQIGKFPFNHCTSTRYRLRRKKSTNIFILLNDKKNGDPAMPLETGSKV